MKVLKPFWYERLETWLLPMQGVVRGLLLLIGVVCIYLAFSKGSNSGRTLALVYLLSP